MEKKSFSSFWKLRIKPDNLGLIDDPKGHNTRILDKQGNMNIIRKGINGDLLHKLVIIPLWQFLLWIVIFYIGVNILFALIYFFLGPASLGFDPEINKGRYFLNCIYFSAQTITTVGYGAINPSSDAANIIASLEALTGWMVFAIITGLVYGRFILPKAGIAFSSHALINTKDQYPYLQCRMAGNMKGILMEVEAKMMISWIEKHENMDKRVYLQLPLEVSSVYMLSLSWTLSHKIDEESPLWKKTAEDLRKYNAEIMVMVKAENELYLQTIHDQTSYITDEIIWDARFKHTHEVNSDGETIFYLDRLDDYEKLT
jgi:inward rectifier potassium channel